jgi:hypothetical protein
MLRSILLAVAVLSGATPSFACSVADTYVRPTNFELVRLADAIIVATPIALVGHNVIRFRVEQVVKGTPPGEVVLGWLSMAPGTPSNLDDLSRAHPDAYRGACRRGRFAPGERYLLFIGGRGGEDSWYLLEQPFSRVSEDYRGEDTAWQRTVRRYVTLQRDLAPAAQREALRAMATSGRAADGSALTDPELADARDQLSRPQ